MNESLARCLPARRAFITFAVAIATLTSASACPKQALAIASCAPDHPARILARAVPPGSWDRPQLGMVPVYAKVNVEVGADGRVVATRLLKSTGWKSIDTATVKVATASKYEAAVKDCKPYSSHVVFVQRWPVAAKRD